VDLVHFFIGAFCLTRVILSYSDSTADGNQRQSALEITMLCDQLYILCSGLSVRSSDCDAKYEMDHVYEDLVSRATGGELPLSLLS